MSPSHQKVIVIKPGGWLVRPARKEQLFAHEIPTTDNALSISSGFYLLFWLLQKYKQQFQPVCNLARSPKKMSSFQCAIMMVGGTQLVACKATSSPIIIKNHDLLTGSCLLSKLGRRNSLRWNLVDVVACDMIYQSTCLCTATLLGDF